MKEVRVSLTKAVAKIESPVMSDAEIEAISNTVGKLIDREFERAFGFPFPEMPPIAVRKRQCSCYVIHRADCPLASFV